MREGWDGDSGAVDEAAPSDAGRVLTRRWPSCIRFPVRSIPSIRGWARCPGPRVLHPHDLNVHRLPGMLRRGKDGRSAPVQADCGQLLADEAQVPHLHRSRFR